MQLAYNRNSQQSKRARVGFYIGDPCNQTCSSVLYHVFCNVTSRRCECRPEYPVNIENRQCVKASTLGGHCDYDEACAFSVAHSSCQSNECRCLDGHEPDAHATKCTPARGVAILENAELTTMVSVIVALMVFTALFCLVLRLFSKARFGSSGRDRMGDAASPPPRTRRAQLCGRVPGSTAGYQRTRITTHFTQLGGLRGFASGQLRHACAACGLTERSFISSCPSQATTSKV
ncbi:hypothetical protein MRX96_028473 [Rhipicephalus microplus]